MVSSESHIELKVIQNRILFNSKCLGIDFSRKMNVVNLWKIPESFVKPKDFGFPHSSLPIRSDEWNKSGNNYCMWIKILSLLWLVRSVISFFCVKDIQTSTKKLDADTIYIYIYQQQ